MATTHYSFPTINGTDTIDGVNAINGLANAVDTALYQVEQEGGGTPGANSINTSMIQDEAVTETKLASAVTTKIKQGVSAASTAESAQSTAQSAQSTAQSALSQIGEVTQAQRTGTGGTAIYVYNPNTKLVVIRGYGTGLNISSGQELSLGTIPSNLRPARQYESGVIGSASGGGALLTFSANTNGNLVIRNQTQNTLNDVMYNGQLVYYIGV